MSFTGYAGHHWGHDRELEGPRLRGFSRLVSSVGYLAGPAVVGEGLADLPANPHVRVVVAGLQGLDHGRDPGRGRAVGDGAVQPMSRPFTVSLTSMLPRVAFEYGHT
jgi:hypothetical protein